MTRLLVRRDIGEAGLEEKRVGNTTVTNSQENVNPIRAAGPPAQAMKPATAGLCGITEYSEVIHLLPAYVVFDGRAGVQSKVVSPEGSVPSVDKLME